MSLSTYFLHLWQGQTFCLHPERVIYWEETATLLLSDVHLGKTGHFRKAGIPVPQQLYQQDLLRLFSLITYFKPKKVLVVGDLFHSQANKEWDWFARWREEMAPIPFILVKGNHEMLPLATYAQQGLEVVNAWEENGLVFVHEPPAMKPENSCGVVSGHVHPAVLLPFSAKQKLRLPCFYFTEWQCILPAFSLFSGTHILRPSKKDCVFAILPEISQPFQAASILAI